MANHLLDLEAAAALIHSGRFLAVAGEEAVLRRLPAGNWIGGTIPYFITDQGGQQSRDKVMVTELAAAGSGAEIVDYDAAHLPRVAQDAPDNGFTLLIVPALSAVHSQYAQDAPTFEDMFLKPIVGWISGVHLDDLGKVSPKVINGRTGVLTDTQAVAIHVPLPAGQLAVLGILNLFRQGDGDVITFPSDGFSVTDCKVNGKPANFARYAKEHELDPARPLVADYNGAQINVSFQAVDAEKGRVDFYAPVFAGIEYKQAAPVGDYVEGFRALVEHTEVKPVFTCNCILNYLYGGLEGRRTGDYTGPITFGEIGYQLLNQTLVYLEIRRQ